MNAKALWDFFEQATQKTSMTVFADCDTDSAPITVGALFAGDHLSLCAEMYASPEKAKSASTIFEELETKFKLRKRYWELPVLVKVIGGDSFTVKSATIQDTETDNAWIELS